MIALEKEFQRIHLLTRKDITNFEKAYGLKIAQRHPENIRRLKDRQLQATVYHNLRLLLEETDQENFKLLLKQTLDQLFLPEASLCLRKLKH